MKKGIFNLYVDYVCSGLDIERYELFKRTREMRITNARWVLYVMCYNRPMTPTQISDLMSDNGHVTSRQNIMHGINKLQENQDPDVFNFINEGIELYDHQKV